ncbi:MAG: OmpA family protein [Pseudomonadota bacterium]|nr:OmpA family protein [Pseudomonadota bacterium]
MDAAPRKKIPAGAPLWMVTFADLMSLLMCFFVLLLAFSEMDVEKYKQIAGSMAAAFGVQRDIFAKDTPMGTSFVAREFSPGRPDPTPLQTVQQKTSQQQPHLDAAQQRQAQIQQAAERIRARLRDEIRRGLMSVETRANQIIIRIQEKGSFPSGSADLMAGFKPALDKLGEVFGATPGRIVVAGHTDDVPIRTGRFRSNWELSAARAVTVVHELLRAHPIPPQRLLIEGHGEVNPLVPNDTEANRALNRRVELVLEENP